eukprot:m51a1_g9328 hypothetical protein (1024) ;mRNA; r:8829-12250
MQSANHQSEGDRPGSAVSDRSAVSSVSAVSEGAAPKRKLRGVKRSEKDEEAELKQKEEKKQQFWQLRDVLQRNLEAHEPSAAQPDPQTPSESCSKSAAEARLRPRPPAAPPSRLQPSAFSCIPERATQPEQRKPPQQDAEKPKAERTRQSEGEPKAERQRQSEGETKKPQRSSEGNAQIKALEDSARQLRSEIADTQHKAATREYELVQEAQEAKNSAKVEAQRKAVLESRLLDAEMQLKSRDDELKVLEDRLRKAEEQARSEAASRIAASDKLRDEADAHAKLTSELDARVKALEEQLRVQARELQNSAALERRLQSDLDAQTADIAILMDQSSAASKQTEELRARVATAASESAHMREELDSRTESEAQAKRDLGDRDAAIKELQGQLCRLQQAAQAEASSSVAMEALKQQNEALLASKTALEEQLRDESQKAQRLELEASKQAEAETRAKSVVADLERQLEESHQAEHGLRIQASQLSSTKAELEQQVGALGGSVQDLTEKLRASESRVELAELKAAEYAEDAQQKHDDFHARRVAELEASVSELQEKLRAAQSAAQTVEQQHAIKELEGTVQQLTAERESNRAAVQQLEEKLKEASCASSELRLEVSALKVKNQAQQVQVRSLEHMCEDHKENIAILVEEKIGLQKRLADLESPGKSSRSPTADENSRLRGVIEEQWKDIEALREKQASLEKQLEQAKSQEHVPASRDEGARLEMHAKHSSELYNLVRSLQAELQNTAERLAKAQAEAKENKELRVAMEETIEQLREALSQAHAAECACTGDSSSAQVLGEAIKEALESTSAAPDETEEPSKTPVCELQKMLQVQREENSALEIQLAEAQRRIQVLQEATANNAPPVSVAPALQGGTASVAVELPASESVETFKMGTPKRDLENREATALTEHKRDPSPSVLSLQPPRSRRTDSYSPSQRKLAALLDLEERALGVGGAHTETDSASPGVSPMTGRQPDDGPTQVSSPQRTGVFGSLLRAIDYALQPTRPPAVLSGGQGRDDAAAKRLNP